MRFAAVACQGGADAALAHLPPMFDVMDDGLPQTKLARSLGKPAQVEPFHFDGEELVAIHSRSGSRLLAPLRLQQVGEAL